MMLSEEHRPKTSPVFLAILVFTFIAGLADLLGVNPYKSFWSGYERMEGYITILHLALYFVIMKSVFRTQKDWTLYLNIVFLASVCVSTYVLYHKLLHGEALREYGTIGHPSFLASYLLLAVFIGLRLLFSVRSVLLRCLYLSAVFADMLAIYFTATRGAILAVFCGVIVFSLFYILGKTKTSRDKLYRKIALSVTGMALLAPLIILSFYDAPPLPQDLEFQSTLPRFATATVDASVTSRLDAWKVAWEGIKKRPVLGWGQENFMSLYSLRPIPYGGRNFLDRAHNIFLDWLINAGITGLLSYLSIFGMSVYVIWSALRKGAIIKIEAVVLITALAAYLVQNLSVFDTINSYLVFFTLLAYIDSLHDLEKLPHPDSSANINGLQLRSLCAVSLALFLITATAYFVNYRPMRESYLTSRIISGFKENRYKTFLTFLDDFKTALSIDTFGSTEVRRLMSAISTGILGIKAFEIEGALKFIQMSAEEAKKLVADDFYNLQYRMEVVDLYHAIAVYEPSFINKAGALIKECMIIAPENQWNYFALADNFILKKDYENALLSVNKAAAINPQNDTVQLKLALAGILTSKKAVINDALENVKKLRKSKEDGIASGLSTDELFVLIDAARETGDYKIALQFYKKIIKKFPGNARYHFDIAEIYFAAGDKGNAIKEAEKAAELDPLNFSDKVNKYRLANN
ncbi:MAG: O-antigen ligase family protein [Nitrospirae bacterium]|nr:O-antigen ligase family protein [Nitrospirota bacterium]